MSRVQLTPAVAPPPSTITLIDAATAQSPVYAYDLAPTHAEFLC